MWIFLKVVWVLVFCFPVLSCSYFDGVLWECAQHKHRRPFMLFCCVSHAYDIIGVARLTLCRPQDSIAILFSEARNFLYFQGTCGDNREQTSEALCCFLLLPLMQAHVRTRFTGFHDAKRVIAWQNLFWLQRLHGTPCGGLHWAMLRSQVP